MNTTNPTARPATKAELKKIIDALRSTKRNLLTEQDILDNRNYDKMDCICHAISWCEAEFEIKNALKRIVDGIDDRIYFWQWFNEANNIPETTLAEDQRYRHMWLNQLIRDYKAMYEAM